MQTQSPATQLIANLSRELQAYPPFSEMPAADVSYFVAHSHEAYFAPDDVLVEPSQGVITHVYFIRRGNVVGKRGLAELDGGALHYEAGDLLPISGALAKRPASATYQAVDDTFCLCISVDTLNTLAARSPVFADFLNTRVLKFLSLSRRAAQAAYASRTLAEQSMERALGDLPRKQVQCVAPTASIKDALSLMKTHRIGSVLVTDAQQALCGILTRDDVIDRVALAQIELSQPVSAVMSSPVHYLLSTHTAHDAVLMMTQKGIRHIPVLAQIGTARSVVNIVSERDLFAMQRLSLKQISGSLARAQDVSALKIGAVEIRAFAHNLLAQGVQARQLTALISHLNDALTQRLIVLCAQAAGLDARHIVWLALGSEGREEQTIATDQDNALVFVAPLDDIAQQQWLQCARSINEALDQMGYPLCKGQIMASNPALCQPIAVWQQRFESWMTQGSPEALLEANIYFDCRALSGDAQAIAPLLAQIAQAQHNPRFLKQMAENALQRQVPLNWFGQIDSSEQHGSDGIDLKLQGTAIVVDCARIFALAHGVAVQNTRERLLQSATAMRVPEQEAQAWVSAFEYLQLLRLNLQMNPKDAALFAHNPNWQPLDSLNSIDRKVLKESLRMVQQLQQRLALDYQVSS